jgi:hypothetical protein
MPMRLTLPPSCCTKNAYLKYLNFDAMATGEKEEFEKFNLTELQQH